MLQGAPPALGAWTYQIVGAHAHRCHATYPTQLAGANNYVLASHKDVPAGAGSSAQASNNEDEAVPRPSVGLMIPIRHGLIGCVS
jgi:hypothetical protein